MAKKYSYQRIHTTVPVDMIALYPEANYSSLAKDMIRRYLSYVLSRKQLVRRDVIEKLIDYYHQVNRHFTNVQIIRDYLKYRHNIDLNEEEALVNIAFAEMIIYGGAEKEKDEILRNILSIS